MRSLHILIPGEKLNQAKLIFKKNILNHLLRTIKLLKYVHQPTYFIQWYGLLHQIHAHNHTHKTELLHWKAQGKKNTAGEVAAILAALGTPLLLIHIMIGLVHFWNIFFVSKLNKLVIKKSKCLQKFTRTSYTLHVARWISFL